MTSVILRPDDGMETSLLVALETQGSGFEVAPRGLCGASGPRRSRRQLGDLAGEHGEPGLVGVGGRQGNLDARDHLGHACSNLDQAEADRVELGLAPEGIAWCQTA
jgi:hypothetical protein